MRHQIGNNTILISTIVLTAVLILPSPVDAQGLDMVSPGTIGGLTIGSGAYQAPNEAQSDSGIYSFARYELDQFAFEIDYGLSGQNFFLGAVDYLYHVPTAGGITQTEVALGGGLTFVNNDPSFNDSKFGPNLLGQVRFMDSFAAQLRYDFLGTSANLWTFGLSYSFF